jgi:small-conductance mechanosensitive channel
MAPAEVEASRGRVTERRIAWLTLVLGFTTGAIVALIGQARWGAGVAVGTALAWLNYRWLRRGVSTFVLASKAQAGSAKPRVPIGTYFLMLFRYGLIAFAVYVIFEYLKVPLLSMVVGLCALAIAAIVASVYEILRPVD